MPKTVRSTRKTKTPTKTKIIDIRDIIRKAMQCEKSGYVLEANNLFSEGIDLMRKTIAEEPYSPESKGMADHLVKYETHAQKLKTQLQQHMRNIKLIKTLHIKENERGNSYYKLFGSYLNDGVTEVQLHEPNIAEKQHFKNLVCFLEMLVKNCPNLSYIHLLTHVNSKDQSGQLLALNEIRNDINNGSMLFNFRFNNALHDRKILFSNGIVIKLDRGLHFFKPFSSIYTLGICDYDFRKCLKTEINILATQPFANAIGSKEANINREFLQSKATTKTITTSSVMSPILKPVTKPSSAVKTKNAQLPSPSTSSLTDQSKSIQSRPPGGSLGANNTMINHHPILNSLNAKGMAPNVNQFNENILPSNVNQFNGNGFPPNVNQFNTHRSMYNSKFQDFKDQQKQSPENVSHLSDFHKLNAALSSKNQTPNMLNQIQGSYQNSMLMDNKPKSQFLDHLMQTTNDYKNQTMNAGVHFSNQGQVPKSAMTNKSVIAQTLIDRTGPSPLPALPRNLGEKVLNLPVHEYPRLKLLYRDYPTSVGCQETEKQVTQEYNTGLVHGGPSLQPQMEKRFVSPVPIQQRGLQTSNSKTNQIHMRPTNFSFSPNINTNNALDFKPVDNMYTQNQYPDRTELKTKQTIYEKIPHSPGFAMYTKSATYPIQSTQESPNLQANKILYGTPDDRMNLRYGMASNQNQQSPNLNTNNGQYMTHGKAPNQNQQGQADTSNNSSPSSMTKSVSQYLMQNNAYHGDLLPNSSIPDQIYIQPHHSSTSSNSYEPPKPVGPPSYHRPPMSSNEVVVPRKKSPTMKTNNNKKNLKMWQKSKQQISSESTTTSSRYEEKHERKIEIPKKIFPSETSTSMQKRVSTTSIHSNKQIFTIPRPKHLQQGSTYLNARSIDTNLSPFNIPKYFKIKNKQEPSISKDHKKPRPNYSYHRAF